MLKIKKNENEKCQIGTKALTTETIYLTLPCGAELLAILAVEARGRDVSRFYGTFSAISYKAQQIVVPT